MLSITGQLKSKEEAIEYNQKIWKFRAESTYTACISVLACEHCYALISDSICLCMGIFTCPNCGKENGRKIPYNNLQDGRIGIFFKGNNSE